MSSICVIPMMSVPDALRISSPKQLTLIQGRKKKRITTRKRADPESPRASGIFAPERLLASMILSHQPRSLPKAATPAAAMAAPAMNAKPAEDLQNDADDAQEQV